MKPVKKIAMIGPESSGKTTLCRYLANRFETVYANEYVRGHLRRGKGIQCKEDLYEVALKQVAIEHRQMKKAQHFLFCDTELINLKVWSEEVFGGCDERLLGLIARHPYDLYLLTHPNLPWSADELREGESERSRLFLIYKKELINRRLDFMEVDQKGAKRQQNSEFILEKIKSNALDLYI